jgi:ubiquinone/menaquinone biosynthesis C-methylase UbiE
MTERNVAQHYANSSLERTILDASRAAGKDPDHLTVDDLAPVDEFHIGGREATNEIGSAMGIARGQQLLDVGSGIGGPARFFASHYGARVTGIDLTNDFVQVAESLSRRLGLERLVSFHCGSGLEMPFPDASFDGAYLFHVGMNIADKARLFAQVQRVLKPGGVFAVYEVMRTGNAELAFPVPWAMTPDTSFLASPEEYRALLQDAGFQVVSERNRKEFALEFFAKIRARMAGPLGLPIMMGPTAQAKIANMVANVQSGATAPVEMICRC